MLVLASEAAADAKAAEAAFERGLELMKEGKYELACVQFKTSLAEDFQYGALYVLAGCEEQRGRLATAAKHYRRLADEDPNLERRKRAADLVAQIEPRIPQLTIVLAPAGAVVTLDDTDVTGQLAGIPVDLGERLLVVTAPGYREWRTVVKVTEEAKPIRVEVTPERTQIQTRQETVRTWHHRAGQIAMIGGGGLVVTGLVFGAVAMKRYDGTEAPGLDGDRDAIERAASAHRWGTASTVVTTLGLVTVAAGVYLWRRGSHTVTVRVDETSTTAVLAGGF